MPVTTAKKTRSTASDPHNIERRLETLIHLHLLDIEENPEMFAPKDRLATIQCVGMFLNRKYGWGDDESVGAGSAVRKYSGAFRVMKPTKPTRVSGGAQVDSTDDEEDAA